MLLQGPSAAAPVNNQKGASNNQGLDSLPQVLLVLPVFMQMSSAIHRCATLRCLGPNEIPRNSPAALFCLIPEVAGAQCHHAHRNKSDLALLMCRVCEI